MNNRKAIPSEFLNLLAYNPKSGEFSWTVSGSGRKVGQRAGCIARTGLARRSYRYLYWKNKAFREHRLAFALMGEEVPEVIDHINGDGTDNRWSNLRASDYSLNSANSKKRRGCSSRFKGVRWHPSSRYWHARITVNYKEISLGYWTTERDAAAAYNIAARKHFGEHAKLNGVADFVPKKPKPRKPKQACNVKYYTCNGMTKTIPEWALHLDVGQSTIYARFKAGWSLEQILTTPRGVTGPKRKGT